MLNYESLLEQARLRGMPANKARGILREYLEILILKEICRAEQGKKLFFTGGTYLRLAHNLKRFSEDLDFNTKDLKLIAFQKLLEHVARELKRQGIVSQAEIEPHESLLLGSLVFPDIEKIYEVVSPHSKKAGLVIKIQSNRPGWKIKTETQMITGFGETYPCLATARGALFADKIDALAKKHRGRHIYDIMFMFSQKFPVDSRVLKSLGIHEEYSEAILNAINRFSKADLKKQAETLRPFLFDEQEADWIAQAKELMPLMIEKYEREKIR